MRYKCENIKIHIDELIRTKPREAIINKLKLNENEVKNFSILRESLDSRFHNTKGIFFVYSALFDYPRHIKHDKITRYKSELTKDKTVLFSASSEHTRPVIVGSGPAGLFCALRLIDFHIKPIIVEMGKDIPDRSADVKDFWDNAILNETSNVQFGLGGAGTFSDGKLTSRSKSRLTAYVLEKFVEFGASPKILYQIKPHIGTDKIKQIITGIKDYIIQSGAEIRFESKLTDIDLKDAKVRAAMINGKDEIVCDIIILAVGNAARDTFSMLNSKNISISPKPIAVGVRIEHDQRIINNYIYGKYAFHPVLKNAEYQLTHKDAENGRSVYSFCNCPGGLVINSSTEHGGIAVNGMSFSKRSLPNANSAVVVNVNACDYASLHPLAGIDFQRDIEKKAYIAAGGGFQTPFMSAAEFLGLNVSAHTEPTIKPAGVKADIAEILPGFITASLKSALKAFCEKIDGFDTGVLTAPETRTSCPVRINRNPADMRCVFTEGLYPIGEGSGYAGGIMSSAVDGVKLADIIAGKYL